MGLFDRQTEQGERTAEERERARAERAARRAREAGMEPPAPMSEAPPAPIAESPAVPETEPEPEPPREPEPVPQPDPVPEPEVVVEAEVVPEPEVFLEAEVVSDPEPVPEAEVVSEPEPEPVPKRMPIPEPAAAREPDPPPSSLEADGALPPAGTVRSSWAARRPPGNRRAAPGAEPSSSRFRRSSRPRATAAGGAGEGTGVSRRARVFAVAGLIFGAVAIWFLASLFQPLKGDGSGSVAVTVPRGANAGDIGTLLADRDVVSSGFFFGLRARLAGKRSDLKPGRYVLRRGMSYGAALDALTSGPPKAPVTSITITEGRSRREADGLLRKTSLKGSYLAATTSSPLLSPRRYGASSRVHNLEGFLFPSTYEVKVGAPIKQLVDDQLTTFKQRFATVSMRRAKTKHLTPYEVLIIASMVEREAQLSRDRPLIAAVIYNRLKQGIPLGIDATIRFATNNYTRPLTKSDLALASPYNTRTRQGLPPGPIGNPGLPSIEAAAHPAAVKYLYYVVKPGKCGEHAFSSDYQQFLRDAQRYSTARALKGGRSPTKC